MMLVFSSAAMMNANSNMNNNIDSANFEFNEIPDCYDFAAGVEATHGGGYEIFAWAYDLCCGC